MKKILLLALAGLIGAGLHASSLKVGTGGETGNYYSMGTDIFSQDYCADAVVEGTEVEVLTSKGSSANLRGMLNKKYSIGIVQTDVLMNEAKKDPRKVNMNRLKIIAGLHIETVHLLIPKGYKPSSKNADTQNMFQKISSSIFSNKDKKVQKAVKVSLNDLKGIQIASWGGSATSAKALSYFFGLNWEVKNIPESQRANITDMPILLVGGMPYKPAEDYLSSGNYSLVGLDYKAISNKAPFYMPSEVGYDIDGVTFTAPSIGIQALLIGKSFRKASRNVNMENLAKCIDENLADLADDPDTNPNWNSVYDLAERNEQINWSYFSIK